MLLLLFLRLTVVTLCINLSYRCDFMNFAGVDEMYRLPGEKKCLYGYNLFASLMYEDTQGASQFGVHIHTCPFFPIYLPCVQGWP